jgi:hypothetical protein
VPAMGLVSETRNDNGGRVLCWLAESSLECRYEPTIVERLAQCHRVLRYDHRDIRRLTLLASHEGARARPGP